MADVMEREAVDLAENDKPRGATRPHKRQRFSANHIDIEHFDTECATASATSDPMETGQKEHEQVGPATQNNRKGGADDELLEKEIRAGITAFVHPNSQGFSGVLKQRYTDFLVNEILPNGQVLHLTNLAPPKRKQPALDPLSKPFVPPLSSSPRTTTNILSLSSPPTTVHPPSSTSAPKTISPPLSTSRPTTTIPPSSTFTPTTDDPPTSTLLSPLSTSFIPHPDSPQRAARIASWQRLPGELARADAESKERSEREHAARLANPLPDYPPTYIETFRETKPGRRLGERQVVSVTTITHNPPTAEEVSTASGEASHTQPEKLQVGPIDSHESYRPESVRNVSDDVDERTVLDERAILEHKPVQDLSVNGSSLVNQSVHVLDEKSLAGMVAKTDNTATADHDQNTSHAGHKNSVAKSEDSSEQDCLKPTQSVASTSEQACLKPTQSVASTTDQTVLTMNVDDQIDAVGQAAGNDTVTVNEEDTATLRRIFGPQTTTDILSLYRALAKHPERKAREFRPVVTGVIEDRQIRTEAHQAVRRIFTSKLDTVTSEDSRNINTIKIVPTPPMGNGRGAWTGDSAARNRSNGTSTSAPRGRSAMLGWADLGGEYLHFTLYNENKDTMESVGYLARQLKVGAKSFQFSGTKDRRAVTVQRVSCYRIHADQLFGMGKRLRSASIGDFEYKKQGLELGELAGNEFIITLRDCRFPGDGYIIDEQRLKLAVTVVRERVDVFKSDGFLNYFGLQRFGSFHATTDSIGTKLLQGNVKGAVEDILEFSPECLAAAKGEMTDTLLSRDDVARAEGINIWNTTQDSYKALDKIPRKFSAETSIIRFLGQKNQRTLTKLNDYQGAMMMLPRNLRLMYAHAYQSLVWNVVAGKRWELYGNSVVEGDLVIVHEHEDKVAGGIEEAVVDELGEAIVRPATGDRAADTEDAYTRARALTKEEVEGGQYRITDVVLPLPGFDVIYPPNAVKECYETFMASERGGGLDPHDMRRGWKDMSLSGGYRKLIGRPGPDMSFEVKSYTEDNEQLVETDLEKLQKQKPHKTTKKMPMVVQEPVIDVNRICVESEPMSGDEIPNTTGENAQAVPSPSLTSKLAVVLKMQLGPSQYATMALRELMGASGTKTYKPDYGGGR